jgi:GNAT superfamily N-acetyltransferase
VTWTSDESWAEVSAGESVLRIGPIDAGRSTALFDLFARVVAAGEGFPQSPPLTRADFEATWVHPVTTVVAAYVMAEPDDGPATPGGWRLAGAYYLKPNSPGRAAHIANAGYVVESAYRGRGVGRALVQDSITRAPTVGFDAIQFNLVFASNPARKLYEQLGWQQIGRIPAAVDAEDAIIYWRAVP